MVRWGRSRSSHCSPGAGVTLHCLPSPARTTWPLRPRQRFFQGQAPRNAWSATPGTGGRSPSQLPPTTRFSSEPTGKASGQFETNADFRPRTVPRHARVGRSRQRSAAIGPDFVSSPSRQSSPAEEAAGSMAQRVPESKRASSPKQQVGIDRIDGLGRARPMDQTQGIMGQDPGRARHHTRPRDRIDRRRDDATDHPSRRFQAEESRREPLSEQALEAYATGLRLGVQRQRPRGAHPRGRVLLPSDPPPLVRHPQAAARGLGGRAGSPPRSLEAGYCALPHALRALRAWSKYRITAAALRCR